jgi:hypothetical protein
LLSLTHMGFKPTSVNSRRFEIGGNLDEDRPLYPDHNRMKELVKSGEILDEVEKLIVSLE